MKKKEIKKFLRENAVELSEAGNEPHINHAKKTKSNDDAVADSEYDKVAKLLGNDIFNHAAIVRQLHGEPWGGNEEATNRSLFRKKLNKLGNDDGGSYSFSEETIGDIQKILMNVSSTITHSIGRKGK
jgi:hypothetical protein